MNRITNDDIMALAEDTGASFTCAEYAVAAAKYLLGVVAENAPTDAILAQAGFMLNRIINAPTTIHRNASVLLIMPFVRQKLRDTGSTC